MSSVGGRKKRTLDAARSSSQEDDMAAEKEYESLCARKGQISNRLESISLPPQPGSAPRAMKVLVGQSGDEKNSKLKGASTSVLVPHQVPLLVKTDTHWDFVMKEMQWLSTDFTAERKRHAQSRRKLANGVLQYFKTRKSRALAALTQAESKRRRLAAKIGRNVQKWWSKMDQIVTYQQKLTYDQERHQAMNRKLVKLVKQTEKYTKSLVRSTNNRQNSGKRRNSRGDDDIFDDGDGYYPGHDEQLRQLKIEEALAVGQRKRKIHDYARLARLEDHESERDVLYGESTTDDSIGSDGSFEPGSESSMDDETTLEQAEIEEQLERDTSCQNAGAEERGRLHRSFVPDPIELQKLLEESTMDINQVLERLSKEPSEDHKNIHLDSESQHSGACKRVHFSVDEPAENVSVTDNATTTENIAASSSKSPQSSDLAEDADDDGDASDVDDFLDSEPLATLASVQRNEYDNDEDMDEFVDDGLAVDDETTMEEEERLPQEMTPQEEINLLEQENNMSIEELRQRYGMMPSSSTIVSNKRSGPIETGAATGGATIDGTSEHDEDPEFQPKPGGDLDDETTIEAEERLGRDMSYAEELAMLNRDNEIPVEELRAMYSRLETEANEPEDTEPKSVQNDEANEEEESTESIGLDRLNDLASQATDEDDAEFRPKSSERDDETTIEAEEKLGREMSYEEELSILKNENELSVDELRAMYAGAFQTESDDDDNDVGDDGGDDADMAMSKSDQIDSGTLERENDTPTSLNDTQARGKRPRIDSMEAAPDKKSRHGSVSEPLSALDEYAELAKSTLATRPFLLASWVKLREYQQIGLNWLISLQSRRLNGILADEMGLGKTLQTIALIAYLASYKGIWGPHLIVVPTSVIVNWETEFKRFCPGLKVLCYYGSAKRRKELRTGWTRTNWNHVVITSYQLAVQDAFAFKRKKWYYMVLDEAQNIKNFQSQRWQTLINFNTQRRLLLTGTPLQNSLMELWSLLHFLMPYIFRSRKEFSFWFENPMNDMIEGNTNENESVIARLHGIIRPFVLRRLKKDVETQMPGKYEHIIKCSLSRRQLLMYEEFMARSSTRKALRKGGNFLGMMNVLMQLRKVCNHPDLFEPRSIITPFLLDPVTISLPDCLFNLSETINFFDTTTRPGLWCGSGSSPSVLDACRHDTIESDELRSLQKPLPTPVFEPREPSGEHMSKELANLEAQHEKSRFEEKLKNTAFLNDVNSWRCRAPSFPFPTRLVEQVHVSQRNSHLSFNVLTTPSHLLALRKSQERRAEECEVLIKKFVFCVPKAGVKPSPLAHRGSQLKPIHQMLVEPIEEYLRPFNKARARLSSFFPDKKLIQFDAGKLQTLAELLRELKRGGHRTLIFTQMSKMLDILEAFLNLNGHTYMRLDGSTGVDRRQRLMDRFNNDPKIFCFILSTRSGGTGVNLIGADTVVFYDSDWNPAMDAQAQDRVHRIGQTRDCHVYRLVTEHTIEENILIKAKQKKNLDILVMDRGKFDSSHLFRHDQSSRLSSDASDTQEMREVYTKGGLRAILGVADSEPDGSQAEATEQDKKDMTNEQMENAMTQLEDADDVAALKGARQEASEELQEFDDSVEAKTSDDKTPVEVEKAGDIDQPNDEAEQKELEKEFESWQTKVGLDKDAIEASLSPVERYGFRWRTNVDPFVSLYAVLEYKRKVEEEEEEDDEIDIDEIERGKALEERQALADGELLGTDPLPSELTRHRNLFLRESARLKASKKKRTLTGENWETRIDARYKANFWYNVDTGEAIWDKPRVLVELEEYETAHEKKWSLLPLKPLIRIMSFLFPFPERTVAAQVCRQWRRAATDPSFVLHVYPVEMGAYTRDEKKIEYNHFRTLDAAVKEAKAGDSIELGDGHYWVTEDLVISEPIRIVGDEHNPSHVVVEMSGSGMEWRAIGGWIEGVTFRRPKLNASGEPVTKSIFRIANGRLALYQCVFDSEGSEGKALSVSGPSAQGKLRGVTFKGGVQEENGGSLVPFN
ncbi:hypothetical protein ACA910_020749 [Epithemia clementina (nom. ined.)]